MKSKTARRFALGLALAFVASFAGATSASAAQMTLSIIHFYQFPPFQITADTGDSVESLKTAIRDVTGPTSYTDMCLVHDGTALLPGDTLSENGLTSGDTVDVYGLPMSMLGHWSITPDEPFLGNEIGMSPVSHPWPTHVELIDGALPEGASLDNNTGTISGTFERPGPFSATFRVSTICGEWDIDWSGSVYGQLADTGLEAEDFIAIALFGTLALTAGVVLMVRRMRRASN